jgi:hypothetical protein
MYALLACHLLRGLQFSLLTPVGSLQRATISLIKSMYSQHAASLLRAPLAVNQVCFHSFASFVGGAHCLLTNIPPTKLHVTTHLLPARQSVRLVSKLSGSSMTSSMKRYGTSCFCYRLVHRHEQSSLFTYSQVFKEISKVRCWMKNPFMKKPLLQLFAVEEAIFICDEY